MKGMRLPGGGSVLWVLAAMMIGGCQDPNKEKIKLLEGNNQALTEELNGCQNDLTQARAERDGCQQDLAAARSENAGLRGQLANQPKEKVPEGWTAVPGGAMIAIEGWALFDSGKATIQESSRKVLDLIIDQVQKTYPTKDVLVFGHTDDVPIKVSGWEDNWELSAQRALAVVRYFSKHGINAKRVVACGCGEHRPRVPNDSERNRDKNRRVEIFVLDPQPRTGTP
ncbi:MAG: OmpA family protein [Planctomycetota bacterium]